MSTKRRTKNNRKPQSRSRSNGRRSAPNAAKVREVARQRATALMTAVHDGDLELIEAALTGVRSPGAWATTVVALLSQYVVAPCEDLAEAWGTSAAEALEEVLGQLPHGLDGDPERAPGSDGGEPTTWSLAVALATVAAEAADGDATPEELGERVLVSERHPQADLALLVSLGVIADACTRERAEVDDLTWEAHVQGQAHHDACGCHNEIDADAVEDHVEALIAERLSAAPDLPARAADLLRRGTRDLPPDLAAELQQLGGTARLGALAGRRYAQLDDDERRLLLLGLLEAVLIKPDGDRVQDRVQVRWRL